MKRLRFPLSTAVLMLLFSITALAGDMQCGVTSQSATQSIAGDMRAGVAATDDLTDGETAIADPVAETALYLTLNVLSLF